MGQGIRQRNCYGLDGKIASVLVQLQKERPPKCVLGGRLLFVKISLVCGVADVDAVQLGDDVDSRGRAMVGRDDGLAASGVRSDRSGLGVQRGRLLLTLTARQKGL